jgi:type 1 glutamine amidotransferase
MSKSSIAVCLSRVACLLAITVFLGTAFPAESDAAGKQKRVLVVTVTKGFRHESIPTAERVLQQIGEKSGAFTVDYARTDEELKAKTTREALAGYDGVVFANTTGDLPLADREAFLEWIKAGHAFVGIHSATDTFHEFAPYVEMINGEFESHGEQATVECNVEDPSHPAVKHLGKSLKTHDEIYLLKNFHRDRVHMLLSLDKHPNTGAAGYYPISWCRDYGKGRVFYTSLGHREDVLEADWYRRHLLGGIQWTLGQAKGSGKP